MSVEKLIARYAADVAFVVEERPATTLGGFAEQLAAAAERLEAARLDEGDVSMAAVYLADAAETGSDVERGLLVKRAARLLKGVDDALSDYRLSA